MLYAGLLAFSVGCNNDKWKQRCEAEHSYASTFAQKINSKEIKQALDSKTWCMVEDDYISDRFALTQIIHEGARSYCDQKRAEANQLIASNENTLTQLVFQKNFPCDGKYSRDLMVQARDIQVVIDSYQK